MPYRLETRLFVPAPVPAVFSFFADARNLEAITPPSLRFTVLTPAVVMRQGTRLDYRLRLRGIPFRWQSEITAWEPNERFKDEQRRGPYRYWRHVHLFRESEGGTLVEDGVEYRRVVRVFPAPLAGGTGTGADLPLSAGSTGADLRGRPAPAWESRDPEAAYEWLGTPTGVTAA